MTVTELKKNLSKDSAETKRTSEFSHPQDVLILLANTLTITAEAFSLRLSLSVQR